MKIESSTLSLSSQYSAVEQNVVRESLRMWVGKPPTNTPAAVPQEKVSISAAGKATQSEEASRIHDQEEEAAKDPRLMLIKSMVEAMTGHKIKLFSQRDMHGRHLDEPLPDPNKASQPAPAAPRRAGYGVEYDYYQSHYESQQVSFSAQGTIKTADGKEISFDMQFSLSRTYFEESSVSLRLGDAPRKTDPLVINFGGTAAQLSDTRFSFDLDSDGKTEQIASLGSGSGFLALDRNADGTINDGSELFGPATGNGFTELASHDEDQNSWIDENDSIYAQLRLFSQDAQGNAMLTPLKQANVGAIFLGSVATPFDLKGEQQVLNGQIRSTGVYLSESGTVGSVQQIDLTV